MLFLPINLESFAYRRVYGIAIHLQCKSNERISIIKYRVLKGQTKIITVMKLINTLSILIFLFIAVACSSESDSVMNDIDNKNDAPASKEVVAAFNISLSGQAIQSRSVNGETEGANSEESEIKNCFIAAVSENGTVLCSFTSDNPSDIKMLVKVSETYQPALTFVAITNVSDDTITELLSKQTLSSIKNVTLTESPDALVKFGCEEITEYTINDKKTDITIALTQRTAAVELESFLVDGQSVVVKSLELVNVKSKTLVEGEKSTEEYISSVKSIDKNYAGIRLYAYENTTDNATALKITYVDNNGVDLYRTYEIKTGENKKILAGKLYKLEVSISPSNNDINFTVKDWHLNTINIGDIMPN